MTGLTPELQEFVHRTFDSVESIEIMMLLRRSRESFWAVPAVAEQLGLRPQLAQEEMDALRTHGVLAVGAQTGAFRYAPGDTALSQRLDELATVYADRRVSVINLIYSANLERLRAFSNAFRVK
jgi:hypothetical protein